MQGSWGFPPLEAPRKFSEVVLKKDMCVGSLVSEVKQSKTQSHFINIVKYIYMVQFWYIIIF